MLLLLRLGRWIELNEGNSRLGKDVGGPIEGAGCLADGGGGGYCC